MTAEAMPVVIDLGMVMARLRRRGLAVVAGAIGGGILAALVLLLFPPRFDGQAKILIRMSGLDASSLVRDRLGSLTDLMPTSQLGGGMDQQIATELALLQSRAVLGQVVDSLRLQVTPKNPSRVPPSTIVDSMHFVGRFAPEKLTLEKGANKLQQGTIWARQHAEVKLLDREDAIDELLDRVNVRKSGGEVIAISYQARDSVTSYLVPNLIAAIYVGRRTTVDRGLNQRRLEFLNAKADSVRNDLRRSADEMAAIAQHSGSGATPEIEGKALADQMGTLEAKLSEIRAGEGALDSLIDGVRGRHLDSRLLAGFPDLLRSPALNDLVSQISRVETERTMLLATKSETSPQAVALAHARDSLAAQLLPIATAFRESLARQARSLDHDLGLLRAELSKLPSQAAGLVKGQAEVTRLAQLNAGMGAQVLQARLAALAEGGDVRLIDAAVAPRRVTFPRPLPTIAVCIAAGLAVGFLIALLGVPVTMSSETTA